MSQAPIITTPAPNTADANLIFIERYFFWSVSLAWRSGIAGRWTGTSKLQKNEGSREAANCCNIGGYVAPPADLAKKGWAVSAHVDCECRDYDACLRQTGTSAVWRSTTQVEKSSVVNLIRGQINNSFRK
jgi:hypothetical protein